MTAPAIVFDIDGTLWDSTAVCARAWNAAVARLGRGLGPAGGFTAGHLAGIMGLTADEIRRKHFGELPEGEGAEVIRELFRSEIEHLGERGAPLYPGVVEGIERLAGSHRLFLVSNCDEPYLDAFLRTSGLKPWLRDWECHGRTGRPKGENLAELIRRNAIAREQAVYVGDTQGDALAARHAGVPFWFVEYGFGRAAGDRSFGSFGELVGALAASHEMGALAASREAGEPSA